MRWREYSEAFDALGSLLSCTLNRKQVHLLMNSFVFLKVFFNSTEISAPNYQPHYFLTL